MTLAATFAASGQSQIFSKEKQPNTKKSPLSLSLSLAGFISQQSLSPSLSFGYWGKTNRRIRTKDEEEREREKTYTQKHTFHFLIKEGKWGWISSEIRFICDVFLWEEGKRWRMRERGSEGWERGEVKDEREGKKDGSNKKNKERKIGVSSLSL